MRPLEALWGPVTSWYRRRATVWIEIAVWLVVLVVGLATGTGWLLGVGGVGLVSRVVTAFVVRSPVGK